MEVEAPSAVPNGPPFQVQLPADACQEGPNPAGEEDYLFDELEDQDCSAPPPAPTDSLQLSPALPAAKKGLSRLKRLAEERVRASTAIIVAQAHHQQSRDADDLLLEAPPSKKSRTFSAALADCDVEASRDQVCYSQQDLSTFSCLSKSALFALHSHAHSPTSPCKNTEDRTLCARVG